MKYEWQEWVVGIVGFLLILLVIVAIVLIFAPVIFDSCSGIECGDPPDSNAI